MLDNQQNLTDKQLRQKTIDKQICSQGFYVANELARLWSSQFGTGDLANIEDIRRVSNEDKVAIAQKIAKLSGVPRATILRILKFGWLPEISTLAAIATGLKRTLVLECRRLGPDSPRTISATLSQPETLMSAIGPWLKNLKSNCSTQQLAASTGISNDTLLATEEELSIPHFRTLFRITTALGFELKLRFRR